MMQFSPAVLRMTVLAMFLHSMSLFFFGGGHAAFLSGIPVFSGQEYYVAPFADFFVIQRRFDIFLWIPTVLLLEYFVFPAIQFSKKTTGLNPGRAIFVCGASFYFGALIWLFHPLITLVVGICAGFYFGEAEKLLRVSDETRDAADTFRHLFLIPACFVAGTLMSSGIYGGLVAGFVYALLEGSVFTAAFAVWYFKETLKR